MTEEKINALRQADTNLRDALKMDEARLCGWCHDDLADATQGRSLTPNPSPRGEGNSGEGSGNAQGRKRG